MRNMIIYLLCGRIKNLKEAKLMANSVFSIENPFQVLIDYIKINYKFIFLKHMLTYKS